MCKFIKRTICIILVALVIFSAMTVWGKGGSKFRMIGEKAGGFIKKVSDKIADRADKVAEDVKKKFEEVSKVKKQESEK
jgi:hypothetical protein